MVETIGKDRFVMINADDFGITRSTNQAIMELLDKNLITSASIMMPCPAAMEAAQWCKDHFSANIGIHLTLTSAENVNLKPVYRERPLRSLTTEEGFFPRDASEVEKNADPEEVRMELQAQIQMAIDYGIDPTHLDNHAGSLMGLNHGRDFLEIAFDLCEQFGLPFNLPLRIVEQPFFTGQQKELFAKRIQSARSRGLFLIDDLAGLHYHLQKSEGYEEMKRELMSQIKQCKPGITQIVTHPALVTPELQSLTPHYRKREMEYDLFRDPEIKELLSNENIELVTWKAIRDIQRSSKVR